MNCQRRVRNRVLQGVTALSILIGAAVAAQAQTVSMTIVNQCSTTIYPGMTSGNYPNPNGGNGVQNWTLAPGANVVLTVPTNLSASRIWARRNCNTTTTPWQCDADQGNTTLIEFTLSGQPGGVDWYDISDVDAYSFPVTLHSSAGTNVTATADALAYCPSVLQVKNNAGTVISCENPCNYYKNALVCQSILSPQNTRDVVNEWPAPAQQYVNLVHNWEGETYTYPYDDWWGLHTVATGANWTITFCPGGINPTPGNLTSPFPLAPTNLAGSSSGTTASLSWTAVAGATGYNVYRTTTEGSSTALPEQAPLAQVTTNSFNDSGLTSGTRYYYIVTAKNASGFSAPTAELWLTAGGGAGATVPHAMGVVTANATGGQVALSWPVSSGATSYDVYPALSSQGEGIYGLSSTPGDGVIELSWTAIGNATSYNLYRSTTAGGETQIASGITNLYFLDGGLANGTTYFYKVAPVTGGVVGGFTNETATQPVAGSGTPIMHSNPWVYNTASASFTQTGLTNGTTYYYIILPHNSVGQGGGSTEVNGTPSTTVYPAGDIAIDTGGTTAVSPWIVDTDFSGGSPSNSGNPINVTGVTNAAPGAVYQSSRFGNSTYTIPGLTAGASYTVRLHFAETFHNGAGQRTFNVTINGTQVLTNFDIFAAAGAANKANIQQFTTTANASGQVVISFVTVADNAQINGIEVYPNGATAPAAPTGVTVAAGNAQNTITWNASAGATSYNLYRSTTAGGEGTTAYKTNVTSGTVDTGLTNGTTYYYKVAALNSVGTSTQSAEASGTPQGVPAAPTALTATAGNTQVTLTWNTVAGATSYNVYQGTAAGGENATPVRTGVSGPPVTITGLTNGVSYYFKVAAVNAAGTSAFSNEANATPTAGQQGSGGISINAGGTASSPFVADVDFTGGTATSFAATVDTSLLSGTIPAQAVLQTNRYGTMSYTIPGLTANASYPVTLYFVEGYWTTAGSRTFNVVANGTTELTNFDIFAAAGAVNKAVSRTFNINANASGQIVLAFNTVVDNAQVNAIVVGSGGGGLAPAAPTNLTATAGNAQVALSWTASSGATSYNVYRGTAAGGESATAIATGVGGTSYTNTGLTNGTHYYFTVKAVNASGTSGASNEANAIPAAAIPAAPTNLTATSGNAQVALSWTASSGATSYNVYRGTAAGAESTTAVATGITGTTYTNTGLTNGTHYYFTVKAVNASGTSGASNEANAIPAIAVPTAPASLTATAGNAQVALSWAASTGATSYNVYRGTAAGGESATAVATGITGTTYTNTGLTNGTHYYFTVKAVNAGGTSTASPEANATPAAAGTFISIDCGGPAASPFVADVDFSGGGVVTWTNAVNTSLLTGTIPAQSVLQSDREGVFTYTIPGMAANSSHTVTMYFVEQYWTAAGKRVFNVTSNGTTVLTNVDPYGLAGAQFKAVQKSFTTTANASGQIVLTFAASADQPKVGGIVVQ